MQGGFNNIVVYNPRTVHGYLQPGNWDYYAMILDPMDTSWMVIMTHPVLSEVRNSPLGVYPLRLRSYLAMGGVYF